MEVFLKLLYRIILNLRSQDPVNMKLRSTVVFKDFARHYNCVINPARGYSPQDKALVENAVHLAYQRIYYPLREMTFFSLEDLNREIKPLLERYNNLRSSNEKRPVVWNSSNL